MQTIQSILAEQSWPRTFNTLHSAVKAVGLEYALDGYKPVTLFAPSDEAFDQLHNIAISDLTKDVELLKALLEYHIVPLKLTRAILIQIISSSLSEAASISLYADPEQTIELPTLSGHTLQVRLANELSVQGVRMLNPQLETDNGVVHPVERVLWPAHIDEASLAERSRRSSTNVPLQGTLET